MTVFCFLGGNVRVLSFSLPHFHTGHQHLPQPSDAPLALHQLPGRGLAVREPGVKVCPAISLAGWVTSDRSLDSLGTDIFTCRIKIASPGLPITWGCDEDQIKCLHVGKSATQVSLVLDASTWIHSLLADSVEEITQILESSKAPWLSSCISLGKLCSEFWFPH